MSAAFIKVAIVIIWELPADVISIQWIQLCVMAERIFSTEWFVVFEHTHCPGTWRGQTGKSKQRTSEFLRVRVDCIEIDCSPVAPWSVVRKVDTPAFVCRRARGRAAQPYADVIMHARFAVLANQKGMPLSSTS